MITNFRFSHRSILATKKIFLSNSQLRASLNHVDGINGMRHIFKVANSLMAVNSTFLESLEGQQNILEAYHP